MQIVTVFGRDRSPFQIGILIQISILPPISTAEHIIIEFLQPISSHIIIGRKSNHVTGKSSVRVLPLILGLKPYAAQAHARFRIRDHFLIGIHLLIFHTFCHYIIRRLRILCYVIPHLGRINPKALMQSLQNRLDIFFLIQQYFRIKNNIIYLIADRKDRAVGIHYIATLKRYCRRIIFLLRQYLLLILFSTVSRDQIQLCTESCKDKQHDQKQYHQLFLHLYRKSIAGISSSSSISQIITCLYS